MLPAVQELDEIPAACLLQDWNSLGSGEPLKPLTAVPRATPLPWLSVAWLCTSAVSVAARLYLATITHAHLQGSLCCHVSSNCLFLLSPVHTSVTPSHLLLVAMSGCLSVLNHWAGSTLCR